MTMPATATRPAARPAATQRLVLLAVVALATLVAACAPGGLIGPDVAGELRITVRNDSGRPVVLTAAAQGDGVTSDGEYPVNGDGLPTFILPLPADGGWKVGIDGASLIDAASRPDLRVPSGAKADLEIEIVVTGAGPRVTAAKLVPAGS